MLKEGSSMKCIFSRLFPGLIIPVIAVVCFVLLAPAFADMKKVDEAELARTNASVTGAPVKDWNVGVEKDAVISETWQTNETLNNSVYSPQMNKDTGDAINLDLNIKGQTTFQFYFGQWNSSMTGGITSVKSH
jgi:hypothetical protein